MYEIISTEQTEAGRWYVRVAISADETIFLKFQDEPSSQQIQEQVGRYVVSLQPPSAEPPEE